MSVPHKRWAPGQGKSLQRADQAVDHQTEDAVNQQADDDHVSAHEVPRIAGQKTDAGGGVDLFDKHQGQPGNPQGIAQADKKRRQGARQDDVPDQLATIQAQGVGGLDQFGVDVANAGEQVQVNREGGAGDNQCNFGELADAEPENEQWHQRQRRNG